MLVLVVGPSGAGKDSLLNGARAAFAGDPRIGFVRRVITRPADPGGEDHEPATEAEFRARPFALSWPAHGLHYGITGEALAIAPVAVANVSRGVIAEAVRSFQVRVIEVTASPTILAARLAARGRENAEDVARRLGRAAAIPAGVVVDRVVNDGALTAGVDQFAAVLRRVLAETK